MHREGQNSECKREPQLPVHIINVADLNAYAYDRRDCIYMEDP